jgi:hypothetical protein
MPELTPETMKELLFAWLDPEVGQPMVCKQCGLEYPRLRRPESQAMPAPSFPYEIPRLFDACPACGASRYDTTWPDRVPHNDLARKALDGWLGAGTSEQR